MKKKYNNSWAAQQNTSACPEKISNKTQRKRKQGTSIVESTVPELIENRKSVGKKAIISTSDVPLLLTSVNQNDYKIRLDI